MRCVIIGNGASGTHAMLSLLTHTPQTEVILVTDDEPFFYSRPEITRLIEDPTALKHLEMPLPGEVQRKLKLVHQHVEGIDPRQGKVYLGNHEPLSYDTLILSTGAEPKPVTVIGVPKERILTLRTARDALRIASFLKDARQPVVLGGGLIGLKVAHTLTLMGMPPRVVVSSPRILSRTLDTESASKIQALFEAHGVTFHLGITLKSADWDGKKRQGILRTKRRDKIPFDILLVGKGVSPRVKLARNAGLLIENGGIAVSESMETSFPHHYATGDCASIFNHETGRYENRPIWPVAAESGRVAGEAAAGKLISGRRFSTPVPRNAIPFFSVPVVSMGTVIGDTLKVASYESADGSVRRTFFFNEGKLSGATLIGDITHAGLLFEAIRRETRLRKLPDWLLQGIPSLAGGTPPMEVLFS